MIKKIVFNPLSGQFDYVSTIPQFSTDPSSPNPEDAWVLRSGSGGAIADGTPIGLLLALTYTDNEGADFTYQFSYRTKEGTTVRAALT